MTSLLLAFGAFTASALLTYGLRSWGWRRQLLDIPNERSSHAHPIPRVGGLAIVGVVMLGCLAGAWFDVIAPRMAMVILPAGALMAVVGFADDRVGLAPSLRFLVHALAVGWLLWCYGGLPPIGISAIDALPGVRTAIGALALVWFINLFNFMDGIDGIAATEAIFIAVLAVLLTLLSGAPPDGMLPLLIGAVAGFLVWNWPRASIFMGDAGSGFLGYVLGALAVDTCVRRDLSALLFVIGAGFFIVDATTMLVRRFMRRERVHQAHRSHAYQHLAIRWNSHGRVVLAMLAINVLWLLPWSIVAFLRPALIGWSVAAALLPVLGFVLWAGAGRR